MEWKGVKTVTSLTYYTLQRSHYKQIPVVIVSYFSHNVEKNDCRSLRFAVRWLDSFRARSPPTETGRVESGHVTMSHGMNRCETKFVQKKDWDYGTYRPSSNTHAQQSTGATRLIFGQTLYLLPYFMCANSEGSGETARILRCSPMR